MSPLLKKEIHLLLPAWGVAMLLALVQTITQPYDFYITSLMFFGLTIMALSSIGRETALHTFSSFLAHPATRQRLWQVKLTVLVGAYLSVFAVWLVAFGLSFLMGTSNVNEQLAANSIKLLLVVSLIATATFTGGLWSTLLLRQLAGAFWLTLLVPVTLSACSAVFFAGADSDHLVIAVLSTVIGIYSLAGFFLARWLFFRAQDVGWSGGTIALPEWKFLSARGDAAASLRTRRPIFALLKKEIQLQQGVLTGAAGLLVLHLGVVALRVVHPFKKDSTGEVLTSVFWLLWLVLPVILGSIAVSEERKLGVMENQLCLPVSRRRQFTIKVLLTLSLGILLGGLLPLLLESIGQALGMQNSMFESADKYRFLPSLFLLYGAALAGSFVLVSFYASSLAKNFLQAIGLALATIVVITLCFPLFAGRRMALFDNIPTASLLPLIIAVPTLIVTLLTLAYGNYKNFRDGWPLWRRNLLGFAGAFVFVLVLSLTLYQRAWEMLEPAEPAHGPAQFSLANPPVLKLTDYYQNLLVRLPDGRVWFDILGDSPIDHGSSAKLAYLWRMTMNPLRESTGPRQFLAGSNWVSATTGRMYFGWKENNTNAGAIDYLDTVGIRPDGTLWLAPKPGGDPGHAGIAQQFGHEHNWKQLVRGSHGVVLLKTDGTLWRWGSLTNDLRQWPGLRTFTPRQIGTNSDWQELFTLNEIYARRTDGKVWLLQVDWDDDQETTFPQANYDPVVSQTASHVGDYRTAFVRPDGTLWLLNRYRDSTNRYPVCSGVLQVGNATDWRAVAVSGGQLVALKADGSLWQWRFVARWDLSQEQLRVLTLNRPIRLGIHHDCVALAGTWDGVVTLAADGSLWLWPDRDEFQQYTLLKLPKQPKRLSNIFDPAVH